MAIDKRLLKTVIEHTPIKAAKELSYDVHRLSPKDIVDKVDYEQGYRFRLSKEIPSQPFPEIIMARSESEIATFLKKEVGDNPLKERKDSMTKEEMEQVAEMVSEKIREDSATAILLLHSIPHAHGSPGIIIDPIAALKAGCKCYDNICFAKGVIGALDKDQREKLCRTVEHVTSPGMTRRLRDWNEAVGVCKAEIEPIPKGERLEPWLSCMGRELPKRGIEI